MVGGGGGEKSFSLKTYSGLQSDEVHAMWINPRFRQRM